MKEVIDSIRVNVFERITSPLFGAFAVAWCGWNYSFILVVVSDDMNTLQKLTYIKAVLYYDWHNTLSFGLGLPLISAAVFIFLYPILAGWCYAYWHQQQIKRKKLRDKIEGSTLLTVDESNTIRLGMIELKAALEGRIRAQEQEIEALRKANAEEYDKRIAAGSSFTATIDGLREQLKERKSENKWDNVSDTVRAVVRVLVDGDGRMHLQDLRGFLADNNGRERTAVRVSAMIDAALQSGLVEFPNKDYAQLTHLGRAYATDTDLA